MCSFFATEIFSYPRLRDVTYYMRLDTDSLLTAPLCYGPFEVVHTRHRSYGYLATASDPPELSVGLWDFVRSPTHQ